jgi:hypothetical protein
MKYILISGKQGSGKSTLQKAVTESWFKKTGRGATSINFADIIYEMHDAVLNVLHQYWPKREGLVKDGPLLQMLGTDWGRRTIDEEIWVKCLKEKAIKMNLMSPDDNEALVIVGDCRFPNEFDAFPEALRIRLQCPEIIRKERCAMWRANTSHPSEIGLDMQAHMGLFDLTFHTDVSQVESCTEMVVDALTRGDWVQRRKS